MKTSPATRGTIFTFVIGLILIGAARVPAGAQNLDDPKFFKFNAETFNAVADPLTADGGAASGKRGTPNYLFETSLRFPILVKDRTKIIGTMETEFELLPALQAGAETDVDPVSLYDHSISLMGTHAFNDTWELTSTLQFSTASSYAFLSPSEALAANQVTYVEKKVNKETSWGFGLATTKRKFNFTILPVIKYKRYFSSNWYLDLFLPAKVLVRKRIDAASEFSVGLRGNAANYFVADNTDISDLLPPSSYRRINIKGLVSYELQLTKWVGGKVEAGALLPYRNGLYTLERNRQLLHDFGRGVTPYANVGLFLTYPK